MAQNSPESPAEGEGEEFLPGYPTVQSFTQSCFAKLVKATQRAHSLPQPGDDFEYYSSFPDFRDFCKSQGNRLLSNVGKLLEFQHVKCGWPSNVEEQPSLDTDDLFDCLVEANDILFERIDLCLDEASGISKNKKPVLPNSMQGSSPVVSSWNKSSHLGNQTEDDKLRFLHAKNILRPQLKFKEKPDNSNVPFVPVIKVKPNASKPLEEYKCFDKDTYDKSTDVPPALASFIHKQRMQKPGVKSHQSNSHPYQYELEEFEPKSEAMDFKEAQLYKPLDETSLKFVDSVDKLMQLLSTLKGVKEFAVDLEHHSFRSLQGFVCLMQISTREEDYLIDTLELRSELPMLNEVFTDPKILKVMHGADMDIGWLQRDFGIYVVNMFDTGQATRVLEYPRFSLAFLLKKFCDVMANKQYQLADWRIRPLPAEMVLYAREDTHYLLYIFDQLRNELVSKGNIHKNLIASVYQRSKDICLKVYEKPIFTSESYLNLYHRHKKSLNKNQLEAFRLIYGWRDAIARLEDESYGYVMPNHMLFAIAEILPKTPQGVLACCNPVPSLVRQNINEIHRLVVQARELDAKRNVQMTPNRSSFSSTSRQTLDSTDPERVTTVDGNEPRDGATAKCEPLTPFKDYRITGPAVRIAEPTISLFAGHEVARELTPGEEKAAAVRDSLKNPFEAFLPAKKAKEIVEKREGMTEKDKEIMTNRSSTEINQQWKTKCQEKRGKEEGVKTNTKEVNRKRNQDTSQELDEENDEVPLRQRKKHKKKNKNNLKAAVEGKTVLVVPDESDSCQEKTRFKPFDYSSARLEFMTQTNYDAEVKKDVFDPYKKLPEKNKRLGSKVHMKSRERSMTFGKKK